MNADNVNIEKSWGKVLLGEFQRPYFNALSTTLKSAISEGKTIYPPSPLIFRAFELTPYNELKVVILGQDPYHNPGQAMGLSFSVPKGVRTPPSLKNIYKELHSDIGFSIPEHGDLTQWAEQGVFLLNAMLTVEERKPGSHKKIGWQKFTDAVIKTISDNKEGIIFMLWGRYAQSKKIFIDTEKHHVLEAAHPSPLARNAFSGCKHFTECNALLTEQGQSTINWSID